MLLEESPISAWRNTGIALHSKHQGVHRRPQGMTMLSPLSEGTSSPLGRRALNFQLPCYCLSLRNSCLTLFFFSSLFFWICKKKDFQLCRSECISYMDICWLVWGCVYVCVHTCTRVYHLEIHRGVVSFHQHAVQDLHLLISSIQKSCFQ